jgi:adenine/guanine phosphoribosyltransferase-like PRPP-binding protein
MSLEKPLEGVERVTIVDDVVTKGSTLLAAASHVKSVLPGTEVRAFALVRTRGLVDEIESIIDPCVGIIARAGNDARRDP